MYLPNLDDILPQNFFNLSVPSDSAKELIIDMPVDSLGFVDIYINDTTKICINILGSPNAKQLPQVVFMAIHAVTRSLSPQEPLPQDPMAMIKKVKAET